MHRTPRSAAALSALAAALLMFLLPAAGASAAAGLAGGVVPAEPTSLGRAIVGFQPGEVPAGLVPGGALAGLPVVEAVPTAGFVVVAAADVAAVRRAVAGHAVPGVAYVEDDVPLRARATPDDARYGSQYGPPMMGFPAAWDTAGYGSADVVVAVLDTGLRKTHEDFEPARVLQGHDYVSDDADPNDRCGHGTHVAGTVAATTDNSRGVAGMSQASILPYKVLDPIGGLINITCTGATSTIAEAIRDAADAGADVISMSLGGGGSNTLASAVSYASSQGVLIVAAAGNDGANNSVDYPAAYPEVIAVGAVDSSKNRASYSDGGPQLDVMAPGSGVWSTYNSSNTSYSSLSGTSMATPHVAGALALALSCAPSTAAADLRAAMEATAEDLGAAGRDDATGYGLARADLLVAEVCTATDPGPEPDPDPSNNPPTATFDAASEGLSVDVDGTASTDPDGDALTFAWAFGDGAAATGATASHTYAEDGTYTITLTVDDGRGGTDTASRTVTVSATGDPDPSTPTLSSGESVTVQLSGTGDDEHYKIEVPAGAGELRVVIDGPGCSLLSCSFDADLFTRYEVRATDSQYACRPYLSGSDETCTHAEPPAGWWYVRVKSYTGSGSVSLTATVT